MRQQLLALEQLRSSKVLTYLTVDRQNLSTQIDEDVIEVFHEQLESLGEHENIDLFLYSRGGSTIVPLPLVRLKKSPNTQNYEVKQLLHKNYSI